MKKLLHLSIILPVILLMMSVAVPTQVKADVGNIDMLVQGGAGGWLNVDEPLSADAFKGRLVLLDFWTYGCINCMQVVPDLEKLEEKFGDKLLIVGVHSAKFDGEKSGGRIIQAARRFNLKHPVINDSDFAIWNAYKVRAWPTLILLGTDGQEISRYAGEGHGDELAADIEKSIASVDKTLAELPRIMGDERKDFELWFPARLVATSERIYIANSGFNKITITDKTGLIKATIGSGKAGLVDGTYETSAFNQPRGLALIGSKLYVADTGNHALREIDLKSQKVTTLAGNGKRGYTYEAQNLPAKGVELASPWDVAVMKDGKTLVLALAGQHQLWTYDTQAATLSVLAGDGQEKIVDGESAKAALAQPSGVVAAGDQVYFVDAESSSLRVVKDGKVETLIGSGLFDFGFTDGDKAKAELQHPQGLFMAKDKIYVADTYNNAIRVFDTTTGLLSTLTTTGKTLSEPGDLDVTGTTALIADTSNHLIQKLDLKTGVITTFNVHK